MNFFVQYLKKLDWGIIISAFFIVCFGLASIYSYSIANNDFLYFYKQLVFFAVGIGFMFAISFFDYRILRNNSYLILALYFISVLLLVGLHFFAPSIRGVKSWYKLGFFTFEPLELAKIVLIIVLAKYFSIRHVEMYKFRHITISALYVFLVAGLVFTQPYLGGAIVLLLIWLGVLIISGVKIKHFLILLLCVTVVAVFSWFFLMKDYQKSRITSFLFPYDVLGEGWSQAQTKIAIGSGQLLGKGLQNNSQVQFGFLPESHTDFIFSAISEEWGLLGVFVLFGFYIFLIWRMLRIALMSESNFPRLFAVGLAITFIVQFVINIGMNLSLLPVIGIYLPLLSYGGSGLIFNFISLGILQSIYARR